MNWGYTRSWAASLGWGDWPTLAACVIAAIALGISWKAQRDGQRSANDARLSRIASERSAVAAEETLADQRREAAERRAAEEEANRPRPEFRIEPAGMRKYRLRNTGTGPATGVTVTARKPPYSMSRIEGVTLNPHEAEPFTMMSADGMPIPGTLYVTWDGQDEEVPVAVPSL